MHKGFEGLVRGLGDLLQVASDVAERADHGTGDGIFGVTVRVGHGPVVSRAGHVSRRPPTSSREAREAVADLFDEDDHYVIVAEFPGLAESAVQWSIRDRDTVVIRATAEGRTYGKDIPLASPVDATTAVARYGNGVLELRVWKQQPR
jgi:HSP20 family molecular chaperone IbpA